MSERFIWPVSEDSDRARRGWTGLSLVLLLAAAAACEAPKVVSTDPVTPTQMDGAAGRPPEMDAGGDTWVLPPPIELPDASAADLGGVPGQLDVVYAHSGTDLYRVDPETLTVSRVGRFVEVNPAGGMRFIGNMTDIAVDRARRIVGLTFDRLLEIDGNTAICKEIAPLPMGQQFNGLSWIRSPGAPEILVATALGSGVFRIDPATGAATRLGSLGAGLQSSGDLVSVENLGTLVTLSGPTSDRLARLDPATGAATIIGDVGFREVWGLGFWKNRVFGFTSNGAFVLIDPRTGAGTLGQRFPTFRFFGAGVTTEVPVTID
jgi:hypothetical protein